MHFTLYVHAPIHIARTVYAVSALNGVHFKFMRECTYSIHYNCNHRGTAFLMHTISGHIGAIGVNVDYSTCAVWSEVVQSNLQQFPTQVQAVSQYYCLTPSQSWKDMFQQYVVHITSAKYSYYCYLFLSIVALQS